MGRVNNYAGGYLYRNTNGYLPAHSPGSHGSGSFNGSFKEHQHQSHHHQHQLNGHHLPLQHSQQPPQPFHRQHTHSQQLCDAVELSKTNLYIRGLAPSTTDEDLREMCNGLGQINSTKAIVDKTSGQCKGYGFVDFDTADAAQKAVKHLMSKNIQAQMARQQEQDPTNLYITNLPACYSEQQLDEMLQRHGTVISTRILRDESGISRGVGFARMDSTETCDKVIKSLNGHLLEQHGLKLAIKYADGNKKRQLQKAGLLEQRWREHETALAAACSRLDPATAPAAVIAGGSAAALAAVAAGQPARAFHVPLPYLGQAAGAGWAGQPACVPTTTGGHSQQTFVYSPTQLPTAVDMETLSIMHSMQQLQLTNGTTAGAYHQVPAAAQFYQPAAGFAHHPSAAAAATAVYHGAHMLPYHQHAAMVDEHAAVTATVGGDE